MIGAVIPAAFIAYWWAKAAAGQINTQIYSSPPAIVKLAASYWQQGILQENILISVHRVVLGFLIGSAAAVFLGVVTGFFPFFEKLLDPTIQIIRSIPIVAILPLFVVWFGFGEISKVLLIVLGILPQTYVRTYAGIVNVDKKLVEVAHVYRLGRFRTIVTVVLPQAAPYIFNALRIASVTAFLLLIFAETVNATSGLGYLENQGMNNLDSNLIILVAVIYAILGFAADTLVRIAERFATPWNSRKAVR